VRDLDHVIGLAEQADVLDALVADEIVPLRARHHAHVEADDRAGAPMDDPLQRCMGDVRAWPGGELYGLPSLNLVGPNAHSAELGIGGADAGIFERRIAALLHPRA